MHRTYYTRSNQPLCLADCHDWRRIGVLPVSVRVARRAHQNRYLAALRGRKGEG